MKVIIILLFTSFTEIFKILKIVHSSLINQQKTKYNEKKH